MKKIQIGQINTLADKLKMFNPICCIAFKRRWVKRSVVQGGKYLMTADGYCTFSTCNLKVHVEILSSQQVHNVEIEQKPLHDFQAVKG